MIKVCHLTSAHNINDGRIFKKECISLAKNGFDVTLIGFGETHFQDIKEGVKRVSLSLPVKNRYQRFVKRSTLIYKKALEVNADIYHFHDPELLPIGLKIKNKGKKVIFDSHEFYGEQIKEKSYIPSPIRKLVARLYIHYETFVCKRIDAVIQICTLNGKNYFEGRSKENVYITNASHLQSQFYKEIEKNPKFRKNVLYVGALSYNRGITHLVKASFRANTRLILAGKFVSEKYKEEVEKMPEFQNVEYLGHIGQAELQSTLRRSYVGISTLLHVSQYNKIDTFPSKIYDYMAAGIPVITSDTEYAKGMIDKFKFGVCVNPSNVEEISSAISYLKKNPEFAETMGKNGKQAHENVFNWENEEKKLIKFYMTLSGNTL